MIEKTAADVKNADSNSTDVELGMDNALDDAPQQQDKELSDLEAWDRHPENPLNWPTKKKILQVVMISCSGFLASIGTSIMSPARSALMAEFNVSGTAALVPITLYVLALGFGPVVGGPMSEVFGRYIVYLVSVPLGCFFTLGAGFTHNFGALCFLRFMAGLCWGPVLAVAAGTLNETFRPKERGAASGIFILMPFLGPGLGPVIGSFIVSRKGWRWTQWALLFFSLVSIAITLCSQETFTPVIRARIAKKEHSKDQNLPPPPPQAPFGTRLRGFLQVGLLRPIRMLFMEPIVGFICLYVSVEFGTLFSFFAGVPYTFGTVYRFSLEQSGLVFLSIVIGCVFGLATIILCDVFLYRAMVSKYPPHQIPPEHRLYPAMIGSIGLPIGLFWFAWTARETISWASPAVAIIPFAWGNLCIFVSTIQYTTDTYHGNVVASAASANGLARYGLAGVFPLFTVQMYQGLGVGWATSLLGFASLALLPIPWVLFKYGPHLRAKSRYETVKYA